MSNWLVDLKLKKALDEQVDWVTLSSLELLIAAKMYTRNKINFKFSPFLSFRLYKAHHLIPTPEHRVILVSSNVLPLFHMLSNNEAMCNWALLEVKLTKNLFFHLEFKCQAPSDKLHLQ